MVPILFDVMFSNWIWIVSFSISMLFCGFWLLTFVLLRVFGYCIVLCIDSATIGSSQLLCPVLSVWDWQWWSHFSVPCNWSCNQVQRECCSFISADFSIYSRGLYISRNYDFLATSSKHWESFTNSLLKLRRNYSRNIFWWTTYNADSRCTCPIAC